MSVESHSGLFAPKKSLYSSNGCLNQFLSKMGLAIANSNEELIDVIYKLIKHAQTYPYKLNNMQKIAMGIIKFLAKHEFHAPLIAILQLNSLSEFMLKKQLSHMPFITKILQSQLGLNLEELDGTKSSGWPCRVKQFLELSYQYGINVDLSLLCHLHNKSNNKRQLKQKDIEQSTQGLVSAFEEKLNQSSVERLINDFVDELNYSEINHARIRAYLICLIKYLKPANNKTIKFALSNTSEILIYKIFKNSPNELAGILFYLLLIKLSFNFNQQNNHDFIRELTKQSAQYVQDDRALLPFLITAERLVLEFNNLEPIKLLEASNESYSLAAIA